jgi:hypothetical protein
VEHAWLRTCIGAQPTWPRDATRVRFADDTDAEFRQWDSAAIWPRSALLRELILPEYSRSSVKRFFRKSDFLLIPLILLNELEDWELKKVASPYFTKWFSIVISKVYAKESKRITFIHRSTSLRESASIENQNQIESEACRLLLLLGYRLSAHLVEVQHDLWTPWNRLNKGRAERKRCRVNLWRGNNALESS